MSRDDLCWRTLTEVGAMLRRREISSVELTKAMLARIETVDARLHSYITVLTDAALAQAKSADAELAAGRDRGPLHGVPLAVKDLCFTRGVRTTCASVVLADFVPDHDAAVVERLAQAGAVILGKLNLTEFAMSGYAPSLPIPINPWNASCSPGGSSSGSGVATAAGLCFASLGTDTGGSIRIPSAWCGVVGLKPTYGRVSRYGVFPLAMTLDHLGPMTRSVADAAAVLEAIAGRDGRDATSLDEPIPACRDALAKGVRGLRIGLDDDYVGAMAHPDVLAALSAALEVLKEQGAEIVPVRGPDVTPTLEAWFALCSTEAVVGHAETYPSRAAQYGPSFRSFLEYGSNLCAADYARAHLVRVEFGRRFQAVFDEVDVYACPGNFLAAPPVSVVDPYGPITPALAPFMRFSAPFNFSGNPTLSLPMGFDGGGLPLGLQFVGPLLGEAVLCQAGQAFEQATDWHRRHPPV